MMTQVQIERGKEKRITMSNLVSGEIGYNLEMDRYVMRIGHNEHAKFLILGTNVSCNFYDYHASKVNYVRRLFKDEQIHMSFRRDNI